MSEVVRTKAADEVFCHSCGQPIKKEAVMCVHCGVQTRPSNSQVRAGSMPKDKTTAVLLAVFLAFWTWLYTYQRDAWKFWLNLVLFVVTFGIWGIVSWIWAIVDVAVKPPEYYQQYPNYGVNGQ